MLTCIEGLLDAPTLAAVQEQLTDRNSFRSGSDTASGKAKLVKHNLQGISSDSRIRGVSKLLEQTVIQHPVFASAARPRQLARLLLSRYEPGMGYGSHIDAPLIEGVRSDVSFTLFLSDPDSYDGGELVIESGGGEQQIKLAAGDLVCYPASYLHRVEPVSAGLRLVAVGWVQSQIRSAEQRALMFAFDHCLARMAQAPDDLSTATELANIRANLLRMWADS